MHVSATPPPVSPIQKTGLRFKYLSLQKGTAEFFTRHNAQVLTIKLSCATTEALSNQLQLLDMSRDMYDPSLDHQKMAEYTLNKALPYTVLQAIRSLRDLDGPSAIVLEGLPLDHLPSTPMTDARSLEKTQMSESIIRGIGSLLATVPYKDEGEKDNTFINQIIPVLGHEQDESSASSTAPILKHTENVFQDPPLEAIILTCLRGDESAYTNLTLLNDILETIPDHDNWVLAAMKSCEYVMKSGASFNGHPPLTARLPILSQNNKGETIFRINLNRDRMEPTCSMGAACLDYLKQHLSHHPELQKRIVRIALKPGQAVIINNRKATHERTAFDPFKKDHAVGERRWLQRCYFKKDGVPFSNLKSEADYDAYIQKVALHPSVSHPKERTKIVAQAFVDSGLLRKVAEAKITGPDPLPPELPSRVSATMKLLETSGVVFHVTPKGGGDSTCEQRFFRLPSGDYQKGVSPNQELKTLFYQDHKKGDFVLINTTADKQVNLKTIKTLLAKKDLRPVDLDCFGRQYSSTGEPFHKGSFNPVYLPSFLSGIQTNPIHIVMDTALESRELTASAGDHNFTLQFTLTDWMRWLDHHPIERVHQYNIVL